MNGHVLVVDDNDDLRLLLQRVLESEGFQTSGASSGPQGLDMLASVRPSCVILDVQMPEIDGWATLERLRRMQPDLPVIMCTVKSRDEDRERGWRLGCDGYIAKPFDITELSAEIRSVLARSAVERTRVRAERLAALDKARAGTA